MEAVRLFVCSCARRGLGSEEIVSSMTPSWSKALVSIDADQWLLNGDRHFYRHDRSPATCTRRSGP
jgi:hypothetical protein